MKYLISILMCVLLVSCDRNSFTSQTEALGTKATNVSCCVYSYKGDIRCPEFRGDLWVSVSKSLGTWIIDRKTSVTYHINSHECLIEDNK